MNPVLLLVAAAVCGQTAATFATRKGYTIPTIVGTAILAASFFLLQPAHYIYWLVAAGAFSSAAFFLRPEEEHSDSVEDHAINPKIWLIPAVLILTLAGYFLDGVVTFAAENSEAPKGVIGFLVLATLTSWPEFKSCLGLLGRRKHLAAILNITVSNITNIWLALVGIASYLVLL